MKLPQIPSPRVPLKEAFWIHRHQQELKDVTLRLAHMHSFVSAEFPQSVEALRSHGDTLITTVTPWLQRLANLPLSSAESKHLTATLAHLGRLHYSDDQRRADRQRLVRVDDVFEVIAEWEDSMIRDRIRSPLRLAVAPYQAFATGVKALLKNGKAMLRLVWMIVAGGEDWSYALTFVVLIMSKFIGDAVSLCKSVQNTLELRNMAADQMRERALPQRNQTRHRREKRTRL